MSLDYQSTQASLREELERLARIRERIASRLARVDQRIKAVSSAHKSLERALQRGSEESPIVTPPGEAGFKITANIREVLQDGKELSAPQIRNALVSRGWDIEEKDYKNPLAIIHTVLKRLIEDGTVSAYADAAGGIFYFDVQAKGAKRAREQEERARERQLAAVRAETRKILVQPCRNILRAYPKGISFRTLHRELEKIGIDLSCYHRPASAIAVVLNAMPDVKSFRAKTGDVVRTYYRLLETNAYSAE